ncbi:hypothetical protein N7E02_18375 [Aliirhizobium terrae]|uniref:hypothetical protein n=1 Tax=Terrirhizobium terrae TaxID=2926709 RepID=UPI002577CF25|nr:hypothetical protein [Rhizobium sp. CC-CFT758]WJH38903.1 hypothetical protein N7E02_18375 [Rhizobium sp. CC-CFT758]
MSFSEIALGANFKPREAIKALSEPPDTYHSFREVLFLGLCGWVTSPSDSSYGLLLMRHGVMDHLSELQENKALSHLSDFDADFVARYVLAGPDFLSDIFLPLGGYRALSTSISRDYLQDWYFGQTDNIRRLASACGVLHFAQTNFPDRKKYHPISQQRVAVALTKLNNERSVRSTLLKRWGDNGDSLALLYAASTIRRGDSTLLDAVLSSEVRAKQFLPLLGQWFGRARYFCDVVLAKLETEHDHYQTNLTLLEPFEPQKFRAPKFSEQHESLVRSAFMRKKASTV